MNWNDVNDRLESFGPSASAQSDKSGLQILAEYAESHGLSPELFMAPKVNALRASVHELRKAVLDDDTARVQQLLEDAATMNITDLRLKLGKKVEMIPTFRNGESVVVIFTREQAEKAAYRLRPFLEFA